MNQYQRENTFSADKQDMFSANVKLNAMFHLPKQFDLQLTSIYLAPDIIPQGKIYARFSIDMGVKKPVQKGRGGLFLNATDVANTLRIKREVQRQGFSYLSTDL